MLIQLVLNANHSTSKAVVVDDDTSVTTESVSKLAINKFYTSHGLRRKKLRLFLVDGTEFESDTTIPSDTDHLTVFVSKGESFAGPGSFETSVTSSDETESNSNDEESEDLYSIIEQVMLLSIDELYGKPYKRLCNVMDMDGIRAVVLIENPENRVPQHNVLSYLKGNENDISEDDFSDAIWPSNGKWRPKHGVKAVIVGAKESVRIARRVLRGQGMPSKKQRGVIERLAVIKSNDAYYFDAQSFWWRNAYGLDNVAVARDESELSEFIQDRGDKLKKKLKYPCVYICGEEEQMEQMCEAWGSEFDLWFKMLRL